MAGKCEKFNSKYAYIDDECINIDDYIDQFDEKNTDLKCANGHQVTCVRSKKRVPHFRHICKDDMINYPMSKWHCGWQKNFSVTEIEFKKVSDEQITNRRCDVLLEEHNLILEFQHSYIDLLEVMNRKNDYQLHNKKIIWIIHDDDSIKITELKHSGRCFIEFKSDKWKCDSFVDYECIFIDINENIYKIYPNEVKNYMIDVEQPLNKKLFITYLKSNNQYIHHIEHPLQCNIYIKQQGAGNGKTYGLIQILDSVEFEHYQYFIMVTKQHSAKYTIYEEFKNQSNEKKIKNVEIISEDTKGKQYKISYINKRTNLKCYIVIGTIDSLMWKLGNVQHGEFDKFEGIVKSIIDGYVEEQDINHFTYGGIKCNLNKKLCLVCDETQDLKDSYAKAIIRIMRDRYIDSYIVGDRLQSINYADNAFTYLLNNEIPYMNKHVCESTNICRRFGHSELVNFVNAVIPFSKYSLPHVTSSCVEDDNNKHLIIFRGKNTFKDPKENSSEVNEIMVYYKNEVINNKCVPEDFLIVTPFTKSNSLVETLENAINMFWIERSKDNNDNTYKRYVVFHKSEIGTSINLDESRDTTRIVSIHASKGDGRKIVFVLGLNEKTLVKFSKEKDNLMYDSLLHVAITRMKEKIYFRIDEDDNISQRIYTYAQNNNICIMTVPQILFERNIKYDKIIASMCNDDDYKTLRKKIINQSIHSINPFEKKDSKKIIDMSHHNIRCASMMIYFYIKIINMCHNKQQICAILRNLKTATIKICTDWKKYNKILSGNNCNDKKDQGDMKYLCVLQYSDKKRMSYCNIIILFMKHMQKKIYEILDRKVVQLCPMESIILHFMICTYNKGVYSEMTINELYSVIDTYTETFNHTIVGHDTCICKEHFDVCEYVSGSENDGMQKYLLNHYENIDNLGKIYDEFLHKYPDVNWLITHKNIHCGTNNDFCMYKYFKLLGYDKNNAFIAYIKPQFNEMNYEETLINSIYDTLILRQIKPCGADGSDLNEKQMNDYNKFGGKHVHTIVFSLDNEKYFDFEWKNSDNECLIKNDLIENIKEKIICNYAIECESFFYYYKYHRSKNIECSSDKFLDIIEEKIKEEDVKQKNIMPSFVLKFIYKIDSDSLDLYDNQDYFITKLKNIIEKTVGTYFCC